MSDLTTAQALQTSLQSHFASTKCLTDIGNVIAALQMPPPSIVTMTLPAYDYLAGGRQITFSGNNLFPCNQVLFGGISGTIIGQIQTTIVPGFNSKVAVTAPAGAALGTVPIQIVTNGGTTPVSPNYQFQYIAPPPAPASNVISASDFTYLGSFRLPGGTAPATYTYTNGGMGFNPTKNSLFIAGNNASQGIPLVAEVSIPAPIIDTNQNKLNVAAYLQPFGDITGGLANAVNASGIRIGGLAPYNGKLYWTAYGYYDANNSIKVCIGVSDPNTQTPNAQGMWTLGNLPPGMYQGAIGGYLATIPQSWQSQFGNFPYYCGLAGTSIISRSSTGPVCVSFDPKTIGPTPCPSKSLLFYPLNAVGGTHEMYFWDGSWVSNCFGSAFISGPNKQGMLFFGNTPGGPDWYGYGSYNPTLPLGRNPTNPAWVDPCSNSEGCHSTSHKAVIWVYDPKVVSTNKGNLWDLTPTEIDLRSIISWENIPCSNILGCAYDGNSLIYVLQGNVYPFGWPMVHVLKITA